MLKLKMLYALDSLTKLRRRPVYTRILLKHYHWWVIQATDEWVNSDLGLYSVCLSIHVVVKSLPSHALKCIM